MSVRTLTASLLTALAMLFGFASVQAQEYSPAADPFAFDPDFRWFEPVTNMDLADMKAKKRANYGWFSTYDRINLYGSRPELAVNRNAETKLDSGWGHRYDIGYMLPDEDNGWLFNWTSNNVTAGFFVERERLNRTNLDDLGFPPTAGDVGPPFGDLVLQGEANTPGLNRRSYWVGSIENQFEYDSYELNKTWRMEPYHYGGILEPMIGVRWMRVDDTARANNYRSDSNFQEGAPQFLILFDNAGATLTDVELLETDLAITENEMLAAQVGFRYTKFRDRFTFSSDFRAYAGGAYQCSKSNSFEEITLYGATGTGSPVTQIINRARQNGWNYERNEEFVVGFDVRAELAYQLTRSISVRGGFQVIDIGRGVWRGGAGDLNNTLLPGGDNDQDLVMVGGTFGLTLNR